jgi:hypothetical protein
MLNSIAKILGRAGNLYHVEMEGADKKLCHSGSA